MMEYVLVIVVAFGSSMLTFFSGFGLGTLLTPVFILFFPIPVAVGQTAIVHLLNNTFKFSLMFRHTHVRTLLLFGLPGMAGAALGAWALVELSEQLTLWGTIHWSAGYQTEIHPLKVIMGALIIVFSLFELIPALKRWNLPAQWLVPGGLLSGFFGGLSGHQGALRSAFLIKLNLSKEAFIATGIAIALLVDISRLSLYFSRFTTGLDTNLSLLLSAVAAAFAGAWLGRKLLHKMTLHTVQTLVGIGMVLIGIGLVLGFL